MQRRQSALCLLRVRFNRVTDVMYRMRCMMSKLVRMMRRVVGKVLCTVSELMRTILHAIRQMMVADMPSIEHPTVVPADRGH